MRLKDSFFFIESHDEDITPGEYGIRLNAGHAIFKGHFPGNPIVPGVCQIQMVTEILEEHFRKDLFLRQVVNIKFLAVLRPDETERLSVIFKKVDEANDTLHVSAMLSNEAQQFSKIKLVYGYERV